MSDADFVLAKTLAIEEHLGKRFQVPIGKGLGPLIIKVEEALPISLKLSLHHFREIRNLVVHRHLRFPVSTKDGTKYDRAYFEKLCNEIEEQLSSLPVQSSVGQSTLPVIEIVSVQEVRRYLKSPAPEGWPDQNTALLTKLSCLVRADHELDLTFQLQIIRQSESHTKRNRTTPDRLGKVLHKRKITAQAERKKKLTIDLMLPYEKNQLDSGLHTLQWELLVSTASGHVLYKKDSDLFHLEVVPLFPNGILQGDVIYLYKVV